MSRAATKPPTATLTARAGSVSASTAWRCRWSATGRLRQPPPISAKPGERFELRAIKLFIDGAMGSRGGLLFEPYSDDPGNHGLLLTDPEVLSRTTEAALRHGWQVCTHAIGDKGNSLVLDAYASALAAVPEAHDPRLRIEHAQVVKKADVERFAALGIIASMQPSHAVDDMRWTEARVGPEPRRGAYAWRWFLDAEFRWRSAATPRFRS